MDVNFMEFVKPELMVLIPVSYLIGIGLKKSAYFADNHIPAVLGITSVVLSLLFVLSTSELATRQECFSAAFTASTQGILAAGASVYVNQLIKQTRGE